MKIAYVTPHPPDDRRAYSGTTYHILKAFERAGVQVDRVGPLSDRGSWALKPYKLFERLRGREYERFRSPWLLRGYEAQIRNHPAVVQADVVFNPIGVSISHLTSKPIAYWADATFDSLQSLYPALRPYTPRTVRTAHDIDRRLICGAVLAGYSSEWAADGAIRVETETKNVAVIPYGSNIDDPPSKDFVKARILGRLEKSEVRFLFVGMDFARKGGPLALEIVAALRTRGINASLTIAGPHTSPSTDAWVYHAGYLSSQIPADRATLASLYASADVFLMPTRADCTPMVIGEAMAYGLPCVTTNVGGVGDLVPAATGHVLPPSAPASSYADALVALLQNPNRYRAMAFAARERYDTVLNWDAAAQRYLNLLDHALSARA